MKTAVDFEKREPDVQQCWLISVFLEPIKWKRSYQSTWRWRHKMSKDNRIFGTQPTCCASFFLCIVEVKRWLCCLENVLFLFAADTSTMMLVSFHCNPSNSWAGEAASDCWTACWGQIRADAHMRWSHLILECTNSEKWTSCDWTNCGLKKKKCFLCESTVRKGGWIIRVPWTTGWCSSWVFFLLRLHFQFLFSAARRQTVPHLSDSPERTRQSEVA